MVCTLCGAKTRVTNSRYQRRSNRTWRRRECLNCHLVFTTEEAVDFNKSWTVRDSKDFKPFSRDKLFLSLYRCLQHRQDPSTDAAGLTETIMNKLSASPETGLSVQRADIRQITLVVLNRFDKVAAVQYEALHR